MSPQPCRRERLGTLEVEPTTHAGLWLDKFMPRILEKDEGPKDHADPRQTLVAEVAERSTPAIYSEFYARWLAALADLGAQVKPARATGRIVVGMGNESVLETAITLHRTYGVPYLPGSALKGLAASYASQRLGNDWQEGSRAHITLFGNTDQAGYVTFFDAYPLAGQGQLVHADIMAIHHPDYYQQGNKPPADWDDPSLVPFLSATGSYALALAGPNPWVNAAFHILANALLDVGVGAKTSSGYGRMQVQGFEELWTANGDIAEEKPPPPLSPERIKLNVILADLHRMKPKDMRGQARGFYDRWQVFKAAPELRRELAMAILAKIDQTNTQEVFSQQNWYRELQRFVQAGGGA